MSFIDKLVLGTAQIGLNYGIYNKIGKPDKSSALDILKTAITYNIKFFDTAYSYGNSEFIIGEFLAQTDVTKVNVVTKLPDIDNNIKKEVIIDYFNASLKRLKLKKVYCYMVHNVKNIFNDGNKIIINTLKELKSKGKITKIGISVYSPNEVKKLLDLGIEVDVIQAPFNLFDQRLLKTNVINEIKIRDIELHVRSVFLQGLLLFRSKDIPDKFNRIKKQLQVIEKLCKEFKIDRKTFLLLFVYSIKEIDKVVIGVESKEQLLENINILKIADEEFDKINNVDFSVFAIDDVKILNPSLWGDI